MTTSPRNMDKAALRGEPSYLWRDGQQRRLDMVVAEAGDRVSGLVLENGCGVGMYMHHLIPFGGRVMGLDFDLDRVKESGQVGLIVFQAAGENVPFPDDSVDLILSNEVIEHVQDDHDAVSEMIRILKPGGRLVLFCPKRGYPFETHGHYWQGKYHFGNTPLINYFPKRLRDRLAPHVRVYSTGDLERLFQPLPVMIIRKHMIYGGYDNIIARLGVAGRIIRNVMQFLEKTPLKWFGLSHFWVIEKLSY